MIGQAARVPRIGAPYAPKRLAETRCIGQQFAMRRSMPNLLAARAFEAFARMGTVRAAADDLAISHTVVSRHIQNLQHSVGAKLVKKSGRGLALTREGLQFSMQLRRAFDLISDAAGELTHGGTDTLHVCCMAGLDSRRLLERLPE